MAQTSCRDFPNTEQLEDFPLDFMHNRQDLTLQYCCLQSGHMDDESSDKEDAYFNSYEDPVESTKEST